jgi:hypothetical protein
MTQGPRRSAWLRGRRAEWLAAWWLRLKGYRILARDLRTPVGEIDLIARRGRVLALVEVKARPSLEPGRGQGPAQPGGSGVVLDPVPTGPDRAGRARRLAARPGLRHP